MRILQRFRSTDDEPEYETTTEEESRDLVVDFQRVMVEFTFVRGKTLPFEYDVFKGRLKSSTALVKSIDEGIYETDRAGINVEKLTKVDYVSPVRSPGSGARLEVYGREVHEVVPGNVCSRTVMEQTEMQVRLPVTERVERRDDTDEVISRSFPRRDGEMEIVERADE